MNATATPQRIRGRIRDYRQRRVTEEEFFRTVDFHAPDQTQMGLMGIASSLAGHGGMGAGGLILSYDKEEADLIEFTLDTGEAKEQVKAYVWESPFKNGDEVELVAEKVGDTWTAFGITRPEDRIVALHPHCSRGRKAHWKAVFSFWWKVCLIIPIIIALIGFFKLKASEISLDTLLIGVFGGGGLTALIFAFIAWRVGSKFMPFVRLAEAVFKGFGWKDVETIDLYKCSKRNRKPDDPIHLGAFYHRY